ncbi:MAG: hypothetical protein E5V16_30740, partial [Mesorhizobium sp.]
MGAGTGSASGAVPIGVPASDSAARAACAGMSSSAIDSDGSACRTARAGALSCAAAVCASFFGSLAGP